MASLAQASLGQSATFQGLGLPQGASSSYAHGLSADGSTVTGLVVFPGGYRAYGWTQAGGMQVLDVLPGYLNAWGTAVSADGAIIVGLCNNVVPPPLNTSRAFRWTASGGTEDLGVLPGGSGSVAASISANGAVIAGAGGTLLGVRAIRWSAGGIQEIATPPGTSAQALAVSADGVVIGGFTNNTGFLWTESGGYEPIAVIFFRALNADGTAGAGIGSNQAVRWTRVGGVHGLGGTLGSAANGISANGAAVVGSSPVTIPFPPPPGSFSPHAYLWTPASGMLDLNEHLPALGTKLAGWKLTVADGVSADGLTLAGTAAVPNAAGFHHDEAWIAYLNPGCYADCNASGSLTVADFVCFQSKFVAGDPYADCNASGGLTVADFVCFQKAFVAGCP